MDDSGVGDTYRQFVELKGNAIVNTPVETPFSNQKVAYCESRLSQVTEQSESYKDSNGRIQTRTRKVENTISNEKTTEPVYLQDNSGKKILLDLCASGLDLDIPKSFDRFEPKNNINNYRYFNKHSYNNADTLGFKMTEKTIKEDQALYVIGEVFRNGNELILGKPMDSKKPFIVTTKSEEDLVNTSKNNSTLALIGGIILIIMGIIMLF